MVDLMHQAGYHFSSFYGGAAKGNNQLEWRHYAKLYRKWFQDSWIFPKDANIYIGYGDEPSAEWVIRTFPRLEAFQDQGFRLGQSGHDHLFDTGGFFYSGVNLASDPTDRTSTRKWNEVGYANVAWYAVQHVGPENPAFTRRQYGLGAYLANFSATNNYAHHFGPYNDRSITYKPMVLAYGCHDGVIDTIQWEGYREGIDDVRYATLVKMLARDILEKGSTVQGNEARKALMYLAELDNTECDLNMVRLEMIRMILHLQAVLDECADGKN